MLVRRDRFDENLDRTETMPIQIVECGGANLPGDLRPNRENDEIGPQSFSLLAFDCLYGSRAHLRVLQSDRPDA